MARKVTKEDQIEMNELYLKYKTYAEVARQTGFSASTVKKYIIPNFIPESQIEVKKFIGVLPNDFIKLPTSLKEWEHLLKLTEEEKLEIEDIRKEILI